MIRVEHEKWCDAYPPHHWDVWRDEWVSCTCGLEREHRAVALTAIGLLLFLAAVLWSVAFYA